MRFHRALIIFLISCVGMLCADELPSPQTLCEEMKQGLEKVKPACVAISTGGGVASAVVISPDGLVICAAHVASRQDVDKEATIQFENGNTAKVKVLGWNLESDIGLYHITTKQDQPWPHVELADSSPPTGTFCFTYAHPSGRLNGTPAQVRMGRIYSQGTKRGKPSLLFADCNIQPGDSGGGLFSLDGKLIGVDSSAANDIGLNLFAAIDQFHLDRKKLTSTKRWGDASKGPENPKNLTPPFDKTSLQQVQQEFSRRMKDKHPPVIDFVMRRVTPDGKVELTQQNIIDAMRIPSIVLGLKQPLSYGMHDPALVRMLPPLPKKHTQPLRILTEDNQTLYGIALDTQHVVIKASLLGEKQNAHIIMAGKKYPVTQVATDKQWDLAILKSAAKLKHPTVKWPDSLSKVSAGDLLYAPDPKGRPLWGNATDAPRAVTKKRSIGPIAKSLISTHRAPYPLAIRHSIPLFAKHAGTPVFDQHGNLAGIHIARFSRTMGLIIPTQKLREITTKLLENTSAP